MRLSERTIQVLWCGSLAAVSSTLVQVALWLVFTNDFPQILFRDAAMAAAIVMGSDVMQGTQRMSAIVFGMATLVHFALSVAFAYLIVTTAAFFRLPRSVLFGAMQGAAMYAINLYGFTYFFPWFAASRDLITFAAHLAFGMTVSLAACYAPWSRRGRQAS